MLAGDLAALKVKRVAVGIVGGRAEHADPAVVFRPSHLPIVGDVAPHEVAALRAPRRTLGPQHPGIEAFDLGVGLGEVVERRIDRDDIGIPEIGRRRAARTEVTRRAGDRCRRPDLAGLLGQRAASPDHGGTGGGRQAVDQRSPRDRRFRIALRSRIALHFVCHHILPIYPPAG
jgi:hypothetical protein